MAVGRFLEPQGLNREGERDKEKGEGAKSERVGLEYSYMLWGFKTSP